MNQKSGKTRQVCILGGSGFVGLHIVNLLAKNKIAVKVLTRRREDHRDLLVFPQLELINADVHQVEQLKQHFSGCDAVINLAAILHESGDKNGTFQKVHVELARKVVEACKASGVKRLLHMSALQADAGRGTSRYLRSKGEAENLVHTTKGLHVTSFRPSVIFGPEDKLFNRFAVLLRYTPKWMPMLLPCAKARFAPVYVEDVARAVCSSIYNRETYGQHYNLCGPKVYTMKQLVQFAGEACSEQRMIWGLGSGLSKLAAIVFSILPGNIFTLDNYRSMLLDSICDGTFPPVFNLKPQSIETVVPAYLGSGRLRHKFFGFRENARR